MNQENCKSWNKYVEKQKDYVENKTFMTRYLIIFLNYGTIKLSED